MCAVSSVHIVYKSSLLHSFLLFTDLQLNYAWPDSSCGWTIVASGPALYLFSAWQKFYFCVKIMNIIVLKLQFLNYLFSKAIRLILHWKINMGIKDDAFFKPIKTVPGNLSATLQTLFPKLISINFIYPNHPLSLSLQNYLIFNLIALKLSNK